MRPVCVYWAVSILQIKGFVGQETDEALVQLLRVYGASGTTQAVMQGLRPSGGTRSKRIA